MTALVEMSRNREGGAPLDSKQAAQCVGKERMERATAQMVARKTNARNRRTRERAPGGLEVNAFAGRFCGGRHIGTVKK